ncbi:lasso peptide biosynthesis B2 protein [Brevundimonas sp. NPDC090276]|uniref:lasso peptide biosynthesis B2 protein n=1 Tax=Brevundimonas sp. NPDC090276 TaxID=3363956 RepID=UPI00383A8598
MTGLSDADLAPGVHLARRDEDVVVLDLRSDAYILIPGAADLLQPVRHGGGVQAETVFLDQLAAAGLVVPASDGRRSPLIPAKRQAALNLSAPPFQRLPLFLHALAATAAFRRRGLAALVETAARRKARARRRDLEAAIREAAAFETIRPWAPFEGDCLQRSWMLHDRLCRRGLEADWVFGVRTWPFFAHCWVQIGDVVVGDSLNRVGGFTPIMAV